MTAAVFADSSSDPTNQNEFHAVLVRGDCLAFCVANVMVLFHWQIALRNLERFAAEQYFEASTLCGARDKALIYFSENDYG